MDGDLRVETHDGTECFRPGDTIEGTVHWHFSEPPERVELRLFWATEGKGDQDLEVVAIVPFDPPRAQGEAPFQIQLPEGPYSFSGKLITLSWALEAVAHPGNRTAYLPLVIAPGGKEIRLHRRL